MRSGASTSARNATGWTPLIVAVRSGNLKLSRLLIDHGADVNARSLTVTGSSVFHFATGTGNCDLLRVLASRGGVINVIQRDGISPLARAVALDRVDVVECVLDLGADPNSHGNRGNHGEWITVLGLAAVRQDTNAAATLLRHGARIDQPSNHGNTPLMLAARESNHLAMVRWLLARGANPRARGIHGHTALIYAAFHGDLAVVDTLLAAGADPKAVAREPGLPGVIETSSITALNVARDGGFDEIARRLGEVNTGAEKVPSP